jgi:hypothetical protein
LNDVIIEATAKAGLPGSISFTDPDAVIVIDTVDDRAGLAIWTREDIARHRLLRQDLCRSPQWLRCRWRGRPDLKRDPWAQAVVTNRVQVLRKPGA